MLSAPTSTAPARSRRAISGLSCAAAAALALDLRAGAGRQAGHVEQVLDRERHAEQRRRVPIGSLLAASSASISAARRRARSAVRSVKALTTPSVASMRAEARSDDVGGADRACAHRVRDRGRAAGRGTRARSSRALSVSVPPTSPGSIGTNTGAASSSTCRPGALTRSAIAAASRK
jgi:hypothetical protein